MESTDFTVRDYREKAVPTGLISFEVSEYETDLWIAAQRDLTDEAIRSVRTHRASIEEYIVAHPDFASTLVPWREPVPERSLVASMVEAGAAVGIGPMAAVAGTVAQAVAEDLSGDSPRVLVENGGDLYIIGEPAITVGLWAGPSPLSGRVGLMLNPAAGIAVCTSSGTVGPSLSFGRADCATVISPSGALADTAATELGNRIHSSTDIEQALDWALSITGVVGAIVILGDAIGAKGQVELVPL